MDRLVAGVEAYKASLLVYDRAQITVIDDLAAGRLVGVGRPSDSKHVEIIASEFWPAAKVDWGGGSARHAGRNVIKVRIALCGDIPQVPAESQPEAGEPSKEKVIRAMAMAVAERAEDGWPKSDANRVTQKTDRNKGGRPSTNREIRNAVRKLWVEKPEIRSWPLKRLVGEVRAFIFSEEERDQEISGYKTESMKRLIGLELRVLRNRIKRKKPNKPR